MHALNEMRYWPIVFDTCQSILNCLNKSFYQKKSTMIITRGFKNLNIFLSTEDLLLDFQQNISLDPVEQNEEFHESQCTRPKF